MSNAKQEIPIARIFIARIMRHVIYVFIFHRFTRLLEGVNETLLRKKQRREIGLSGVDDDLILFDALPPHPLYPSFPGSSTARVFASSPRSKPFYLRYYPGGTGNAKSASKGECNINATSAKSRYATLTVPSEFGS